MIAGASIVLATLAGFLLGAVLNVLIIRLPREHLTWHRPHCTGCGTSLTLLQLAPIVGWLWQRGRASCCGKPIHWIAPLVELITGIVLAVAYARYQFGAAFFYLTFVTAVLVVTGAIDWKHRFIYTFLILGAALLVFPAVLTIGRYTTPLNAFAGALVAGLLFLLLYGLARLMFPGVHAPFGLGDVYLGIFLGAAVGLTNLLPVLMYGIIPAGVYAGALLIVARIRHTRAPAYIAYGAFLCLGALAYLTLWGLRGA